MTHDVVQTSAADTLPPFVPTTFWTQFRRCTATVKGVRLHGVEGGDGAPILLLPGWPQSWYAWRYVMPLLVGAGRHVIALDPRGMGDSDRPASGYEMRTVSAEIHSAVESLALTAGGPVDVVGHDIGTWIGYAYSAEWPHDVKRLAVFDQALPGITPPPAAGIPSAETNVKTWHFAFNRLPWTITPGDLDEYVRVTPPRVLRGRRSRITGTSLAPKGSRTAKSAPSGSSLYRCSPSAPKPARAPP